MSVYGGDSWGREAQCRKRRLDDLLLETLDGGDSFKRLSSGKYACVVCRHNPILDSPLALSMHCNGSQHRAAESRLKERELKRLDEINKRIALSDCSSGASGASTISPQIRLASKPLIEQTRKTTSEILHSKSVLQNDSYNNHFCNAMEAVCKLVARKQSNSHATEAVGKVPTEQDHQRHRERELKFIAAGWIRDCHGRWVRDENVEFDSDEEDPNVCLR